MIRLRELEPPPELACEGQATAEFDTQAGSARHLRKPIDANALAVAIGALRGGRPSS